MKAIRPKLSNDLSTTTEISQNRIKPLHRRAITIKFESHADKKTDITYQTFRKKQYTKTMSIQLRGSPISYSHQSRRYEKEEQKILLLLVRKAKTLPSLSLNNYSEVNQKILRMGRASSLLKELPLFINNAFIEHISEHISMIKKAKGLERLSLYLNTRWPKNASGWRPSSFIRPFSGYKLHHLQIYLNTDGPNQANFFNVATQLIRRVTTISLFYNWPRTFRWKYEYKYRIIDADHCQAESRFTACDPAVQCRSVELYGSPQLSRDIMNFQREPRHLPLREFYQSALKMICNSDKVRPEHLVDDVIKNLLDLKLDYLDLQYNSVNEVQKKTISRAERLRQEIQLVIISAKFSSNVSLPDEKISLKWEYYHKRGR